MIKKAFLFLYVVISVVSTPLLSVAQSRQAEKVVVDTTKRKVELVRSRYSGEQAATDYYMRGKELMAVNGDIESACQYFLLAFRADSLHAPSNYELARVASPTMALPYSLRANNADSTNLWYQDQLAEIYINLRDLPSAIAVKEKSIRQDPKNEKNYRDRAAYYYYSGDLKRAFAEIERIYELFDRNAEVAMMHCNMLKSLPPSEEYKSIIEGYVNEFSEISDFVLILADTYARMDNYTLAVICYKKVKETDSDDLRGDVALFDYYNSLRNEQEMIEYIPSVFREPSIDLKAKIALYEQIIADNVVLYRTNLLLVDQMMASLVNVHSTEPTVRKIYTDHLVKKGSIDLALDFNKEAIAAGVADYAAYETIIQIEAYHKNVDSVMFYIDKALPLFPDNNHNLKMLKVYGYDLKKDYSSSIALLEREAKVASNDSLRSIYFTSLGDIYNQLRKTKSGVKSYEKALKYDHTNIVAMNNYSYMLSVSEKNLERALTLALQVINKEPSNPTYIDTYGWVLYKMKRYKEAREVLLKAVALDTTKSSSLMLHYGDVMYRLGEIDLAKEYWAKAQEFGESEAVIKGRFENGAE